MKSLWFSTPSIIVGVRYSAPGMIHTDARGGKPYGSTTIAGPQGQLEPTPDDLTIARLHGKRVAQLTSAFRFLRPKQHSRPILVPNVCRTPTLPVKIYTASSTERE
jgi:hypothetical protein